MKLDYKNTIHRIISTMLKYTWYLRTAWLQNRIIFI